MSKDLIKIFDSQEKLIAILVRESLKAESLTFLTSEEEEFQLGLMNRGPNSPVKKHRHNSNKRSLSKTSEFLMIRKGEAKLSIWSDLNEFIIEHQLFRGDCILLLCGYHKVDFETECEILEIKQGPYNLTNDKSYLE